MFTLTVIHRAVGSAAYGRAETIGPFEYQAQAAFTVSRLLTHGTYRISGKKAKRFATANFNTGYVLGTEVAHVSACLSFRIDRTENAGHPCPCCGGLVLPTDHGYADVEDAYCLGCFTWDRNTPGCLPANTAHPEES